jgi:hypothetical protein
LGSLQRDGVTDAGLADVLHAGDEVADLADAEALHRLGLRGDDADLEQLVRRAGRHHLDLVAGGDPAVDDADVGDDAAVDVVDRVEDHRPGRRLGLAGGGRDLLDDPVEQLGHADTGLAADPQDVLGLAADDVRDLLGVPLRLGGREVDLVEHRDDREVVLQRQVEVGERLGLDALGGVDQQDRTLAGGQRPGHLVREVHVPRCVDHVEHELGAGVRAGPGRPRQPHVLRLDGDAALALDVHAVEVLGAHLAPLDEPGHFQHPVGQRRLAVVDVGDDAEVPDEGRIGGGRSRHSAAIVPRRRVAPGECRESVRHGPFRRVPGVARCRGGLPASTLVILQAGPVAPTARTHCQNHSLQTFEAHAWRTSSPR